ncbi:TonB-dependent receptor [Fodinibius sediminis]|uniref:Iron complex outermembrane recepter protein n=1 Tax=Fodinibius sediminis TaxID=1214077 RepID=A0A521BJU6_9BACT|nr:TonB-dependent receptor [Fodinibius sediminis]SMO47438.1 iron complex outermembrane recepter protein [Fodinibius sediminis]
MRILKLLVSTIGISLLLAVLAGTLRAQQRSFEGKILDRTTEQPVIGAHIHWQEEGQTTVTDKNGMFEFKTGKAELTLHISYVGYRDLKLQIMAEPASGTPHRIYLNKKTHAMSPVTVLARKQGRQPDQHMDVMTSVNPSHDAGTFLKDSPNISGIRKGGGFGVDPVVRGFKKNQLIVQQDGVLQSQGACPNRMDPPTSHIQMEQVEEIEILKGPYALKHGPSFGGVINFKSQRPNYYQRPTFNSYMTIGYESNIGRQRYAGGIEKEGGDWTTNIHGSFTSTDDYKDGSGNNVRAGLSNVEYTVETSARLTDVSNLSARFSQGFVRDAEYPALMMDMREDNTTNLTLSYLNTSLRKGRLETSLFGSYVDHQMDNLERKMARMVEAVTDVTTETYGYDLSYTLPAASGSWFVGTDATFRALEGFRNRTFQMGEMAGSSIRDNVWQGGKRNRWGTVVEYQPSIRDWAFVISSRFDYYYSNASDPDAYFKQQLGDLKQEHLGWSASAGFTRELSSRWSAGFWVGRAERYPGMDELFVNYLSIGMDPYEYVGNPRLNSETNHQIDALLHYSSRTLSVKTSVFYSYVRDYISAALRTDLQPRQEGAPGVKQFKNIDEAALYGFEWTLENNGQNRLGYELSSAYTIGRNLSMQEDLPQIPAFEANLKLDYRLFDDRLIPQIHLRGVAGQTRVAESFDERPTDGYLLTNLKLTSRLFSMLRLSAGVNNLFDVTYHEHLNRSLQGSTLPLNDPGRSIFVELKWNGLFN